MRSLLCATALAALTAGAAAADSFNRIASFPVTQNLPGPDHETSAEIIAATADGMTLVYSDSPLEALGLIDIADPRAPKPLGAVMLGGEPTSVVVVGGKAYAGVNTSESYVAPSGYLAVVDLDSRKLSKSCDLGGQPDSIAAAKDGSFVTVAIENERDEDLNDGVIPQLPAGDLVIIPLTNGAPDCAGLIRVDMTGLAEIAPSDPEPEFVDVNGAGEIVVTMQENNHLAVVSAQGKVITHFSAGAVDLVGIDASDNRAMDFSETQTGRKREPDSVKWIDDDRFVTANEGDYEGGSRGFTIWAKTGEALFESGPSFEHELVRLGHYPDKRSDAKGVEPEGVAVGKFGGKTRIFVMSERGSAIGVYADGKTPALEQVLPSGIGPESGVTIPGRNLFVSANEVDGLEDKAARSHVMIYELSDASPSYPMLVSGDQDGQPIGWGAISGLVADMAQPGVLWAVNDSFYRNQPSIFRIDATQSPARITEAIRVTRDGKPMEMLDQEGITLDGMGGFWIANEGHPKKGLPHRLIHVDGDGALLEEATFPAALTDHARRFSAEGVAMLNGTLWIAMQREWGDDPEGMVKLVNYDPASGAWGAVHYPLDKGEKGWVGLSEITIDGDHAYILERDNQIGDQARIKKLYRVALSELTPAKLGGKLPVVSKALVRDLLPDLLSTGGYAVDKVEGFAIDANGVGWVATDNDGVDDSSGETLFWSIGAVR